MIEVSVIVPVFNAENHLERCVRSLLNQTLRDIEVILVDDGSTDSSPLLCDEYASVDSRIKVIHCQNGGVSAARNRGMEVANGRFLSFVDSDDWLSLDSYVKLVSKANEDGSDIVFSDYMEVFEDHQARGTSFMLGSTHDETVKNMLMAGPRGGNIWNFLLVRRSMLIENDLCFPTTFKRGEDFWFAIRCYILSKRHSHADCIYYYNCANASSATHNEQIVLSPSYLAVYDSTCDFMKQRGCWGQYSQIMNWRCLVEKTVWTKKRAYYHCIREIHPEANAYISSCPFLGKGMKLVMSLISRRFDVLASLLLGLYELRRR